VIVHTFYLGIHRPNWLADPRVAEVPVFISRRTFLDRRTGEYRRTFPKAVGRYAVDSGGFTELQQFGRWTISAEQYVAFLRRMWVETGPFDFAAPRDRMCEPWVINGGVHNKIRFEGTRYHLERARPGWTFDDHVHEHQVLTAEDYVTQRRLAPELPIAPALQGWTEAQYVRHFHMYRELGVDLGALPVVMIGSLCRRQNTNEAFEIIDTLHDLGVRHMHGLGFKIEGLRQCWAMFDTADSLSASLDGRYAGPCQHPPYATGVQPKSEANCLPYFLAWMRRHIKAPIRQRPRVRQLDLLESAA
jgi:hypothetical protein